MESNNEQQESLYGLMRTHTPKQYQERTERIISAAEHNHISPRTLEKMLRLGKRHTDNSTWDARNLENLRFVGNDRDIIDQSTTGHEYHFGPRFKNTHDAEHVKGQGMGWSTGIKFNEILMSAGLAEYVGLHHEEEGRIEERDELRRKEKDYLRTLKEARQNPDLVKDIQSVKERRQVRALIGLDEAIEEATRGIYKSAKEYMASEEFFSDNYRNIMELILPKKGVINRLSARKDVPEEMKKKINMYKRYGPYMTPEERDGLYAELEVYDAHTALVDVAGHARRYVDDLKELSEEQAIENRPVALLKVLSQLQGQAPVADPNSIAAFAQLYDVPGERVRHYEKHLQRSEDFRTDYEKGSSWLRGLFIEGSRWKGGANDSVPTTISESLEGIVKKRGDPFLRQGQRWFQNEIYSEDLENNIATQSIREAREETDAMVVLQRRRKAKERGITLIDNRHRVTEDFEEEHGMRLEEFVSRLKDQESISTYEKGSWHEEERDIRREMRFGLYVPERLETFTHLISELRDNLERYDDEKRATVEEYVRLHNKAVDLEGVRVETIYFTPQKEYVRSDDFARAKTIVQEKRTTIEEAYEELGRAANKMAEQYKDIVSHASDDYLERTLEQSTRIVFEGTRYEEKEDFREAFGEAKWDAANRHWYVRTRKARAPAIMRKVNDYNERHEGKISVRLQ